MKQFAALVGVFVFVFTAGFVWMLFLIDEKWFQIHREGLVDWSLFVGTMEIAVLLAVFMAAMLWIVDARIQRQLPRLFQRR
ncbi:MAG: hypothetical protein AAB787_02505 [Patescibacteria group bacterium]